MNNQENNNKQNLSNNKIINKRNISLIIFILLLSLTGFMNNEQILKVKLSKLYNTDYTLEEYYKNAFGNVTWNETESNLDKSIISVSGKCNYNGDNVEFEVEYEINGNTYTFESLYIDGNKKDISEGIAFINSMEEISNLDSIESSD